MSRVEYDPCGSVDKGMLTNHDKLVSEFTFDKKKRKKEKKLEKRTFIL